MEAKKPAVIECVPENAGPIQAPSRRGQFRKGESGNSAGKPRGTRNALLYRVGRADKQHPRQMAATPQEANRVANMMIASRDGSDLGVAGWFARVLSNLAID